MSPLAKVGAGLVAIVLLGVLVQACFLSGGGGGSLGSIARLGSLATATAPATLPTPILLAQSQGGAATSGGSSNANAGSNSTYTVKSGDTLGSIATAQGIPQEQQAAWIADVLRLNGIADARLLAAGQVLVLPRPPAVTATARPTGTAQATGTASGSPTRTATPQATGTARPTATTAAGGAGTYTVVSGDYPLLIAQKLGVPEAQQTAWVNQLIALNPGINPNNLSIGQVLQLPPGTPGR